MLEVEDRVKEQAVKIENKIYVLVSDHEPITHKAECLLEAYSDKDKAHEQALAYQNKDNEYEDIAVVTIEHILG